MNFYKNNYYKLVTMIGILFCLAWIIIVDTVPFSDFNYYNELAKQIANGGQWGDTYTSVGYSIILGFIYKIFGYNIVYGKIFNIFLTFINYIVFYNILLNMNLSENKRKVIYTIFVFFPNNIFYNSLLGTEILFTNILLIMTLIYHSNIKYKYYILGILTGINTMIKPFFIIFFFAVAIIELVLKFNIKKVFKNSIIILITSILVISPWIYRNSKLIGEFTLVSNNGGIVLYINNNSQNDYGRWMPAKDVENSIVNTEEYSKANITEKNRMLTNASKKWIKEHPIQFVKLGFKRLVNTYFIGDDITYSLNGTNLNGYWKLGLIIYTNVVRNLVFIPTIIYICIYSVKIISNILKKQYINKYDLYNLVCFYMFTCVYFITEGQARYSFPFIFIIIYFFSNLLEKSYRKLGVHKIDSSNC